MADFLEEKRREITRRLDELKPLVEEHRRLEGAASALDSVAEAPTLTTNGATRRRGRGRRPGSGRRSPGKRPAAARAAKVGKPAKVGRPAKRRPGRRKGSGTRGAEALAAVKGQPGITVKELAAKMGIGQNYLYRVMPALEKEKKVKKQGRGWHPAT
jgi:hypothetical protein